MSSPLDDNTLTAATRLKSATAAMGGNYPTVATALASSDLSPSEVNMVSGFVKGLDTSVLTNLANQSGASVDLSPQDQDHLYALGETAQAAATTGTAAAKGDPRNWLERAFDTGAHVLSGGLQWLTQNPVSHYVFEGFNDALNAVKYPFRLLSASLSGGEQSQDISTAMRELGYDPNSTKSYLAFMFNKPDAVFHDLSGIRAVHGNALVDLAILQHNNPEQFNKDLTSGKLGKFEGQDAATLAGKPEFQTVAKLIDQHAISPGRDLANLITFGHTNNTAFHLLSGTLDATFDIAADPTLILGKVAAGMRGLDYAGRAVNGLTDASRFSKVTGQAPVVRGLVKFGDSITGGRFRSGIRNALDDEGMRQLVANPNTLVGQQARGFLDAANQWRQLAAKGDETSKAQAAGIFADMNTRYKAWMPFLDEVTGKHRVIPANDLSPETSIDGVMTDVTGEKHLTTRGEPITDAREFADYLGSNQGLLRMGHGIAARNGVTLPGRVSLTTRMLARRAAKRAQNGLSDDANYFIDHSNPGKNLPNEAEESIQQRLDQAYSIDAKTGDALYNALRKGTADGRGFLNPVRQARAKWDQTARRWSTFAPTMRNINLQSAEATQLVRRVARMYLQRGHADQLVSAFANGTVGQRRQIFNSILEQSFHASGLSRSTEGITFMDQYRADQEALDKRAYGLNGTDVIKTPAGDKHVALYPSQISQYVAVPDFKQLSYIASKSAAAGWLARTRGYIRGGVQSPTADALMGMWKRGLITTPNAGIRNTLDEVAGGGAQNMIPDMLKGRALHRAAIDADRKEASAADVAAADALKARLGSRLPTYLRHPGQSLHSVLTGSVLGKLAHFTRTGFVIDPDEVRYAQDKIEDDLAGLASEAVVGTHFGEDVAEPFGNEATVELHRNGVAAAPFRTVGDKVRYAFDGWQQVALDGHAGVHAWVGQLNQKFLDSLSPAHVALRAMMEGGDALGDVVAYMRTPAMRHFLDSSEFLNTLPDAERAIANEAERDLAIERYAQNMIADVAMTLRGRGRPTFDDDLVAAAREWRSQDLRGKAAALADSHAAAHLDLVDMAEEARSQADELTTRHTGMTALHRAHAGRDKAVAAAERAQQQLDNAKAELDRAVNGGPGIPGAAPAHQFERADEDVQRISERVDGTVTRRDNAKANQAKPETRADLQERVKKARADLARATRVRDRFEQQIREANGSPANADKQERLAGKVERHTDRAAAKTADVQSTDADVALAQHDSGLTARPSDQELEDARHQAVTARNRASYFQKRVETNARKVQQATLNADHGLYPGHLDDQDIARYLRETGQDPILHDPNQGGAAVVDAVIHPELAARLLDGDIPDAAWLTHNVPEWQRPAHTIKPTWAPVNPATGNAAQNIARGYAGLLSKAYGLVVEKPVQAVARNPMRTAAYVQARKNLAEHEQWLVNEAGFTPEIANQTVRRMANIHADQLVIRSIDNATVETQFEMMSRNWWAFVRAQADWLRRWSRIVKENPAVIRKAQLMLHAGTASGMLDQDPQTGQLNFIYPGSGAVINALTTVAQKLGIPGLASIPMMPDLKSNVAYLNPSADNPLGYSSTPIVSVPFHIVSAMMGSHAPLLRASADQILNGQLGAGRAWYENFMPSYIERIYSGVFQDPNNNPADAHSQLGSAMHSAMLNMAVAGYLDDPRLEIDPTYRQQFLNRFQTQTKTQMAMRALLGFILPAPPTAPTEDVKDKHGHYVNQASYTDHKAGIMSLSQEAQQVFGNMSYADASAYWAKHHPDELPYEQGFSPETQVGTRDAVAAATLAATKWMSDNPEFQARFGQAGGLAVYFMPQGVPGSVGGKFSQLAYNAQLEEGARKYLTTTDQFNNLLVKNAEQFYFHVKKQYDTAIADASANGDQSQAQAISDEWSRQKDLIYATNPLLAQKFVGFASNGILNTEIRNQLNQMLSPENIAITTKAIGPDQVQGVAQMLLAQRDYADGTDAIKGQSSPEATAQRAALKSDYEDAIAQVTKRLPGLADLANGAFNTPN